MRRSRRVNRKPKKSLDIVKIIQLATAIATLLKIILDIINALP